MGGNARRGASPTRPPGAIGSPLDGEWVEVSVRDASRVSPPRGKNLFVPFFTPGVGTGLGLAISQRRSRNGGTLDGG